MTKYYKMEECFNACGDDVNPMQDLKDVYNEYLHDQGEDPGLSDKDIETIREQKPGIIYNGSNVKRCNICGSTSIIPNGACCICTVCGSSTGACG